MSFNIVDKLVKAHPKKRLKMVFEMQKKNIKFFKTRNPELAAFIEQSGTGNYEIRITEDFLEIIDQTTGEPCHPPGRFHEYLMDFSAPHHTGWIDKLEVVHQYIPTIEHGRLLINFLEHTYKELPHIPKRFDKGMVSLPRMDAGKRYSGVTVFLGIFTGLHIAQYLKNTEIRDIFLIEPDVYRFGLSCFFLDYAAIEKRFDRLIMHVGPNMPDNPPELLMGHAFITATAWLRILPAYPSQEFDELIAKFNLKWRALTEIFVPFDREIRNLCYGAQNLKNNAPINYKRPELSENSRIAIVASGPSLDNDLDWLKENQDKLIIFAAHSAMRTLNKHGITPDFQCSLDTELDEELIERLELNFDIPLVSYFKAKPESLAKFKEIYLVNDVNKANPVKFDTPLFHTHPTTGNLMVAIAGLYAQPKELYLVGLDLGYRDSTKDHTGEYWANQGKEKPEPSRNAESIIAPANFKDKPGQMYTQSYFNSALETVEAALTFLPKSKIINVSDGVEIKGTTPTYTKDLVLEPYVLKESDLHSFKNSFVTEYTDAWVKYNTPGEEILNTIKASLKDTMKARKFDWKIFTEALDQSWRDISIACTSLEQGDGRVEAYAKLIHDLMTEWYRVLIFTKNHKEAQIAYQQGLIEVIQTLDQLEWPKELDELE